MILKKIITGVLGIVLTFSTLTGCGGKTDAPKTNDTEKVASTITEDSGTQGKLKEPIELTIHSFGYKDDFPVFTKAAELTGVTLKGTISNANSNATQAFNIMMASGEYSDIIRSQYTNLKKYATESPFVPLDDLIDQYAPNIKKFFEENPWAKKGSLASDGKLYYIPLTMEGEVAEGFFIRKDWLNNLGLETPKTVDEYYNVLKAFHDNDPNGNGKQDEVPFFHRNKNWTRIISLYGARTDWYIEDGKFYYGKYQPEYKIAMENMAKWYAEGLIDKEIYTRGGKAREVMLGDNVGGSTHDWFASTGAFNDLLKDEIPGFEFAPIAPPDDINGEVWEPSYRKKLNDDGWCISVNNKNPIETIKYFDFWFSEEGRRLYNYGVEGVHYTMVDNKPVFKDEILHDKSPLGILSASGIRFYMGANLEYASEEQFFNEYARQGVRMYADNKYPEPELPRLTFTVEEQKIITEKWTALDTYMQEKQQKWVFGTETVDENFDEYIQNLKSMGMDEIIQIYNDAYQRYLKD